MPKLIGFKNSDMELHIQTSYFSTARSFNWKHNELLKYWEFENDYIPESRKDH